MSSFVAELQKLHQKTDIFSRERRLLLAVSGGIDSLCMAQVLAEYRRVIDPGLFLEAANVQIPQTALKDSDLQTLRHFFKEMNIPLTVINGNVDDSQPFSCYICARERRKRIFQHAAKQKIGLVALGHNLDDYLETALLNLVHAGHMESLQPVQSYFNDKIMVIRPLLSIRKKHITAYAKKSQFPKLISACAYESDNRRAAIRAFMAQLQRLNRAFIPNLRKAVNRWNKLEV